ncbi:MAG TPA: hypothetical protein PKY77_23570 [Phycisphaerae bacterium]|nr:hypothetical protein [Phycisphaerae bacterium]HRY66465.1 hypothetical protein [Phycisphaerae bacterium]HSA25827.1 hypothetical protein [Phycisphaerae bacterium]
MTSGRGQHYLMVLGFLAIIAFVGPFQAISELRDGETPQVLDLFRQWPTEKTLKAFENDLKDQTLVAQALRPRTQYLRYRAFGDVGEQALVGRNGWWFYRLDARYLTERCPDDATVRTGRGPAVKAIASFRDQLAQRGIHLLVVPIPGKPSVYPDRLTRRAQPADSRVHEPTRRLLADLAAASVETMDLFPVFAEVRSNPPSTTDAETWYLQRDTHWTAAGARLAAGAVARRIRTLGWAPDKSVDYAVQPVTVQRPGDVLHMLKCPPIEALFEPEAVCCQQVIQPDGQPYRDDPASSVLVLGDSFLRIYQRDEPGSAGFIAHLARELGRPVTSIVSDGGASTLVRQELARKPAMLTGKRLVVWEFVERDVRFGMEGWQEVTISAAE